MPQIYSGRSGFHSGRSGFHSGRQGFSGGRSSVGVYGYNPLERLVRDWEEVRSTPTALREPRAPEIQHPDAYIEWGKPSEFASSTFRSDAGSVGANVDDDEEPERVRWVFSEEGRGFRDYLVESEEEPDAYIVLRCATSMAFSGPNGEQFRITMSPEPPGTQTGAGQTPPTPPLEQME